ncbi:MAG: diacylglycerol O-acyltransferase / wax synthase [Solirubrobacteraceae bacterium]|nr:diacylglycerol O-acyltransferase / wax synthase [Solirubrobacteraceae bacterium]
MSPAQRLSPLDAMFLWGERPDTMFHVASLLPFTPPEDAPPTYLRDYFEDARDAGAVESPWNRKLRHPRLLASPVQSWITDTDFDIDYHLRRSALPSPGDERELGVLISRLHSHALDLSRPPWEMHLIENLEGGRFAVYTKVHHALVDGYTGMKMLIGGLSKTADDETQPFFTRKPPGGGRPREDDDSDLLSDIGALARAAREQAGSAVTLAKRIVSPFVPGAGPEDLVGRLEAPRCILNERIGRRRRFATQQYEFQQLKDLGAERGATINDVFLCIVGGGLRAFLTDLGELPDKPLIAFLPVNVRSDDDAGGGNAVGAILATLGTDIADPIERLERVTQSTRAAKAQLRGMTQEAILAYSMYTLAPGGLQALSAMTGIRTPIPQNFNVVVSNVPGADHPLYLRGSRCEACYPVSIPVHGVALNITVQSYDNTLCVGFVGDRDAVPHLQRLALHTGDALADLDRALSRA